MRHDKKISIEEKMKVAGFKFTSSEFRYALIEANSTNFNLLQRERFLYPKDDDPPNLLKWIKREIDDLLTRDLPDKIGYRTDMRITNLSHLQKNLFPQAILNLISAEKDIPIKYYLSQSIIATKVGRAKDEDILEIIEEITGTQSPYFDKHSKESIAIAWLLLLGK